MDSPTSASQSLVATSRDISFDEKDSVAVPDLPTIQVLRKIWFIILVSCMFHIFMTCEIHIFLPYLYSRVHCCNYGGPNLRNYNVSEPAMVEHILQSATDANIQVLVQQGAGNKTVIPACAIPRFTRNNSLWSLSASCVNRAYVEDTAQKMSAVVKTTQKIAGLVILPIGGAIADGMGRRPVLAGYAMCLTFSCGMYAIDSVMHMGDVVVWIGGVVICVVYQPQQSILSGCVADMIGHRERDKNAAFAIISTMNISIEFICNMALYFFLKLHLQNYSLPWMGLALLSVVMLLLFRFAIPESLPLKLRKPFAMGMLNPVKAQVHSIQLVMRDPVLWRLVATVFLFWIYFLGFQSIKVSYLISIGFSVEATMLPEIIANAAQVFFASFLIKLMPEMGAWKTYILGHTFFATAYLLWGPITIIIGRVGAYVAHVVQAAAFVCIFPSWQAIISQRVNEHDQGKCQSAVNALGTLGIILGVPLYNRFLFTATSQGFMKAVPAVWSMILAVMCCLLSRHIEYVSVASPPVFESEMEVLER